MTEQNGQYKMESKLAEIQQKLECPKARTNQFGGYQYRNLEDIMEAVKPLLEGATVTFTDDVVAVGDRVFVKSTVTFAYGEETAQSVGFAQHDATKKGMDGAQITGACSSYARKYAANGLFLIDDSQDADATNTHGKEQPKDTVTESDLHEIKQAREQAGLSKEKVMAICKESPFSCRKPPYDMLSKHTTALIERIRAEAKGEQNND